MKTERALAALVLAGVIGAGNAAPQRIVSLNLCADELVLRLAAPGTVKSVTWLARDPALSNVSALAQDVPVNRGLAEDVVPLAPGVGADVPASTASAGVGEGWGRSRPWPASTSAV